MKGYNLRLIRAVTERVSIPVIAAGGAGCLSDFVAAVHEGHAAAVAAGSFYHYTKFTPNMECSTRRRWRRLTRSSLAARKMILFETHQPMYDKNHHDMSNVLQRVFECGYEVEWLVADHFQAGNAHGVYRSRGYTDDHIVAIFQPSDRAIYRGVSSDDATTLICDTPLVRAALLSKSTTVNTIQKTTSS